MNSTLVTGSNNNQNYMKNKFPLVFMALIGMPGLPGESTNFHRMILSLVALRPLIKFLILQFLN